MKEPEVPVGEKWTWTDSFPQLALSGFACAVAMTIMTVLGGVVSLTTSRPIFLYTFGFAGIGFFIVPMSIQVAQAFNAPRKIGHASTNLLLSYRDRSVARIRFDSVGHLSVARYPSGWYVELETSEGKTMAVGRITREFGMDLLKAYDRFSRPPAGAGRLRERKGIYPSIRLSTET